MSEENLKEGRLCGKCFRCGRTETVRVIGIDGIKQVACAQCLNTLINAAVDLRPVDGWYIKNVEIDRNGYNFERERATEAPQGRE